MKFSQNGYNFSDEEMFLDTTNQYCVQKGLKDVRVFLVTRPDTGYKTYLIFENGKPVYEDSSLDGIGCHIDMMALAKDMK